MRFVLPRPSQEIQGSNSLPCWQLLHPGRLQPDLVSDTVSCRLPVPQTRSLCTSRVSERLILRRWVFLTCTMPRKYNMPCEFKHTGTDIAHNPCRQTFAQVFIGLQLTQGLRWAGAMPS